MEAEVFDAGVGKFVGEFEFLGVKNRYVLEFPPIGELKIDTLVPQMNHPSYPRHLRDSRSRKETII